MQATIDLPQAFSIRAENEFFPFQTPRRNRSVTVAGVRDADRTTPPPHRNRIQRRTFLGRVLVGAVTWGGVRTMRAAQANGPAKGIVYARQEAVKRYDLDAWGDYSVSGYGVDRPTHVETIDPHTGNVRVLARMNQHAVSGSASVSPDGNFVAHTAAYYEAVAALIMYDRTGYTECTIEDVRTGRTACHRFSDGDFVFRRIAWDKAGTTLAVSGQGHYRHMNDLAPHNWHARPDVVRVFSFDPATMEISNTPQLHKGKWTATVSPDGQAVAMGTGRYEDAKQIVIAPTNGTTRPLTPDDVDADQPLWSRTGRILCYARPRGSTEPSSLWIIDADGSNVTELLHQAYRPGKIDTRVIDYMQERLVFGPPPAWSPNGLKIATIIRRDFDRHGTPLRLDDHDALLRVIDVGSDRIRFTDIDLAKFGSVAATPDEQPLWSPDGQRIAIPVERPTFGVAHATRDIVTVNADGSDATCLQLPGTARLLGWR